MPSWKQVKTGNLPRVCGQSRAGMAYVSPKVQMTYLGKFALEDVDLVQEEDDRRAEEPPGVDNTLEEDERFGHPVLWYERNRQRK